MRRHRLLALILVSFAACSRPESSAAATRVPKTRVDAQRLVRRLIGDVKTLNPVRAETMAEVYVASYLHTPLIYLDRDLKPIPGLATLTNISADGRTYQFEVNPRATFSDGSPVRASDVVFTLEKACKPQSRAGQMAGMFEQLDESRTVAIGNHTVVVAFREPFAGQLARFNRVYVVPERIYGKGSFSDDFNDRVVGTGPYVLFSRSRGKNIVLKRRENYWREKALIPTILFQVLEDDTTAWNAFKRGELDETRISSQKWEEVRNDPTYSAAIRRFYTFSYEAIAWNGHHPILGDKRMRRALALCVPTQSIIEDLAHGTARPLSGPFMPESYASNPTVVPNNYDPDEAKRILAELGWRDHDGDGALDQAGKRLAFEVLYSAGNDSARNVMLILQGELRQIGVAMSLRAMDETAFIAQVLKGEYEAAYIGMEIGQEPDPFSLFHSSRFAPGGWNFVFYSNPEADRLMAAVRRETDRGKRAKLYQRLHALLADDQPYTWLMQVQDKWLVSERLKGVSESQGYGLFRWYPGELGWRFGTAATGFSTQKPAQHSRLGQLRLPIADFVSCRRRYTGSMLLTYVWSRP